ncbi:ABC transporter permease [Clostridioides difficile]|nr:ABC transporter permease [Clostridioides difficile]MBZ0914888.1 ABC transporter permease [Clostridioides difficile]MBZ1160868.1 ABC transporter permease [Clostridioides difficile]MCK1916110.1 ABC transporter permease [Clostridioides difficile]MCL6901818.1 ABC transporter permease [Clostridioides difficile]
MFEKIHKRLKGYYIFLIILILWKIVCVLGIWSSYILPPPEIVLDTFIKMIYDGSIFLNVYSSVRRILIGFLISSLMAIPLGVVFGVNKKMYEYFKPLFEFMRSTPPLALVPMLILWFGIGEESKIIIIILASFFPIFLNTLKGIKNCDNKLIEVGKSFNLSKKRIFYKIIIPNSMLDIVVGLSLGLGYSFRAIIGAELIAASSGLGYLISDGKDMSRTDVVLVGIFVIGFLGILSDYLFSKIITKFSKGKQVDLNG